MIEWLTTDVALLTSVRSGDSSTGERPLKRALDSLQSSEYLLITAGALLSHRQRMEMEAAIARGLICLSKGIFSVKCDIIDRKVCRGYLRDSLEANTSDNSVEILRCSSVAQLQLIRLAVADVTAPSSDGTLSGNITLLKNALDLMCSHANPECRFEGRRVTTILSAILHPVSVPLPAGGSDALVRNFVDRRVNSLQQRASAAENKPIEVSPAGDLFLNASSLMKPVEGQDQQGAHEGKGDIIHEVVKERSSAVVAPIPIGFKDSTARKLPVVEQDETGGEASKPNKRSFRDMNGDADNSDDSELPEIVY